MGIIAGGDLPFFWQEAIRSFIHTPIAWDGILSTGLGTSTIGTLWIQSYVSLTALFSFFNLSWGVIALVFWIIPAIILAFFCPILFIRAQIKLSFWYALLGGLLYSSNTYFLMMLSGGQIGVALGYAIAPLVLFLGMRILEQVSIRRSILFALLVSLQVLFDPRIAYVTLAAYFLFFIFAILREKKYKKLFLFGLLIPLLITILLHGFWLLPLLLFPKSATSLFSGTYASPASLSYFSFATLENSLSLLHPNWPENIFGKIGFMKPEFLLLPILAYSSLFFKKSKSMLFFALLGLIGAFLAKGTNAPFGFVYEWLFVSMPGFILFRDPTKWYTLVAISYAVLIPFALSSFYDYLSKHQKFQISNFKFQINTKSKIVTVQNVFLAVIVFYFLYLVHPLFVGQVRGIFVLKNIPKAYYQLESFMQSKSQFSRTLWVPQRQRFGFYSPTHPAVSATEYFETTKREEVLRLLQQPGAIMRLRDASIQYIIVPDDSEKEIFLTERKYNSGQYAQTIASLKKIPGLLEKQYGKIMVFTLPQAKDHFWLRETTGSVSYKVITPSEYQVTIDAKKDGFLVFAEHFDANWQAKSSSNTISARQYDKILTQFPIKAGKNTMTVLYAPQKFVDVGFIISIVTLVFIGVIYKKYD